MKGHVRENLKGGGKNSTGLIEGKKKKKMGGSEDFKEICGDGQGHIPGFPLLERREMT